MLFYKLLVECVYDHGHCHRARRNPQVSRRSLGSNPCRYARRARTPPLSLQSSRLRSPHHQLRRRQHQFQSQRRRSAHRRVCRSPLGQRLRRRSRQHQARRFCHALSAKVSLPRFLSYKGVEHEDEHGGDVSALRLPQQPRRRLHRHAAARLPALPARRSSSSRLGHRSCRLRQRQRKDARVQSRIQPLPGLGSLAASRLRARPDDAQSHRRQPRLRRHRPRRPRPFHLGPNPARVLPEHHHHSSTRSASSSHNHGLAKGPIRFGGEAVPARADRASIAVQIAPYLRGRVSAQNIAGSPASPTHPTCSSSSIPPTPRSLPSSAPVAPTTSSAPKSGPSSSPGQPMRI